MASDVRIETSRVAGGAGRNVRAGCAGGAVELQRGIRAHKPSGTVGPAIINQNCVVVLGCLVVINLTEDARSVIHFERREWTTGTEGIGGGRVRELRVREAMLLSRRSSSGDDAGEVHDRDERKSGVAIDNRKKKMWVAILRKSHNATCGGQLIAA